MRYCNNALCAQNIVRREIGNIRCHLARFKRRQKVCTVYKPAAREIEYTHAVTHFGNSSCVYKIFGRVGQRHVNSYIIALFKNFVYIKNMHRVVGQIPCGFNREVRVVAENLHTEGVCGVRHHNAYSTETYNAEGLSLNFGTRKSALALFNLFAYLCAVAFKSLSPLNTRNHAARADKQTRYNQLLNGVCVSAGGVEYNYSLLGAAVNRYIVCSRACTCYGFKACGELNIMQRSRAHNSAVGIFHLVAYGVFIVKGFKPCFGNFIVGFNFIHYAFSSSNFFINSTSFSTPSTGIAL